MRGAMKFSRRQMLLGSLVLGVAGLPGALMAAKPQRASAAYTGQDRRRAIERGLQFIYATARVPANFARYGDDYLWCFTTIANTSADPALSALARRMGLESAAAWRRLHPRVPADAAAEDVASLAYGAHATNLLGLADARMHANLQRAAAGFEASDFLDFDPAHELPPADVPATCVRCSSGNDRGVTRCAACGDALEMRSPYAVLMDALTTTYIGDRYGIRLGASFPQVAGLIPRMRPYRGFEDGANPEFLATAYAVTHIVYTLNDYGSWRLKPEWLPQEFAFLKANLEASIALEDPESLGEFVDTLKAFGITDDDPLIRSGIDYLMASQNRDGSWGHVESEDIYERYHPTWTAIDGLRDFAFKGEGVSFPAALEAARGPG